MNTFGRAPRWGSQWKAFIKENADRSHSAYIQKTTLPYEDNYLDLDPDGEGSARVPGHPHHRRSTRRTSGRSPRSRQDKMEQWYRAAGAIEIQRAPVGGAMGTSTHAYGGTRMGDNAETNVVNRWGFSHEAPNLGVLGASVMGTSGAQQPDAHRRRRWPGERPSTSRRTGNRSLLEVGHLVIWSFGHLDRFRHR